MLISLFKEHREKINFLLIGIWNTVFGYFTFVALYYLLNHIVHYVLLLIISNIISITNAFVGYKLFVFKTKGNYLKEYFRFYLVYGVSILLNIIMLPIVVETFKISPVLAQPGFIFITVIVSYFGHKNFSFRKSR